MAVSFWLSLAADTPSPSAMRGSASSIIVTDPSMNLKWCSPPTKIGNPTGKHIHHPFPELGLFRPIYENGKMLYFSGPQPPVPFTMTVHEYFTVPRRAIPSA